MDAPKDIQPLKSCLPAALIRGVPCDSALQGYGQHWQSNAGRPEDFLLSESVQFIDDFISHDWRTPARVKHVALCYVYNGKAAVVGTACATALVVLAKEIAFRTRDRKAEGAGLGIADVLAGVFICPFVFLGLFFSLA
eukprot:TRINITY_DN4935_c0_g6_i1.p2 TRINITY_DN4935_c0_g6~~TRINITY_DN4935_c0_g6_i1.p2  ORF type:complete len:138 (-),score=20.21 TRINITY_DN4935_c0_g6_i1:1473-1886(-)